tara:strand:+ start:367 stop:1467 length:1101 start_codon:yes stop_codon:yes gene_type:complete
MNLLVRTRHRFAAHSIMMTTPARKPISIMAFPHAGDSYTDCFYAALKDEDITVHEGIFAGRWLYQNLRDIDYIHFHWPSFYYNDKSRVQCLYKFSLLVFLFVLTRIRSVGILWTVHNLMPHDRCVLPSLDRLARRLLIRLGTRFFVHGPSAEAEALKTYPGLADRMVQIEHGHWIGYYPNVVDRAEARRTLDISDNDFLYLFLGACKPYKDLEKLVESFAGLPDTASLFIVGRFMNPDYEARIRDMVDNAAGRITMITGFVPDDDLQTYFNACDITVLSYAEVLTSGSAMLSLSFGRPVIAPAIGFMRDVIPPECGYLYDNAEPDGLHKAMIEAADKTYDKNTIIEEAKKYQWAKTARIVRSALEK